jgi:hypothetical protein
MGVFFSRVVHKEVFKIGGHSSDIAKYPLENIKKWADGSKGTAGLG